jgi:hypothetical protein
MLRLMKRNWLHRLCLPVAVCVVVLTAGCQTLANRQSYSLAQMTEATIGIDADIRFFPELEPDYMAALGWNSNQSGALPEVNERFDILALSSGGPDGAYGVGVLKGMTDSGTRPDYEIITGISTGALIAPFAFVGSAYDTLLEKTYTSNELSKVLGLPSVFSAVGGPSLYPANRIPAFMNRHVNANLLAQVAAEHARGRRLLIATANLDNNVLTVWNMGRIAALPNLRGLELFREIMRAAIAIPGALPPIPIETQTNGATITELHGDAGILAAFYAETGLIPDRYRKLRGKRTPRIDVIIHNQIEAQSGPAEVKTFKLAGRSVSNLIRTSIKLLLDQSIDEAEQAGIDFRYTFLPSTWHSATSLEFDAEYMRKAFELGYSRAIGNSLWHSGERK